MIAWLPLLALASVSGPHSPSAPAWLDTPSPGFRIDQRASVAQFAQVATVAEDVVLVFDGGTITLVDLAQGTQDVLATLTPFVFASFVVVEPTLTHAIVGESSNHTIFRIALDPQNPTITPIANVLFNFAAVLEDPSHLLVSALTGTTTPDNEILRIDLGNGAQTVVAQIPGPSGPLARAANGDLYYAPQSFTFPTPPGTIRVIRWTKTQIESGILLTDADATTFVANLDGVASLVIDPVTDHVLVAESRGAPSTSQIDEYAPDGALIGTVLESPNWLANLELLTEAGPGSFQAFQPQGIALRYVSADFTAFGAPSTLTRVRTIRPVATTSGPGVGGSGNVVLRIEGAHPNATVFVVRAPLAAYTAPESTYSLGGFLMHSGLAASHFLRGGTWLTTDLLGRATTTFTSTGAPKVVQALVADPGGALVGSTTTAFY